MSGDGFTLFSTAHISRDEYTSWLQQLSAVMIPEDGGAFDARLSKDARHVWIRLLEKKRFDMTMSEMEEETEEIATIRQLLGGETQSAIVLLANNAIGSQILAVQFAALCTQHYPCVVYQEAGHAIFPAQELLELRDAGMGFDGSTWETADPERISWNTRIIEEVKKC